MRPELHLLDLEGGRTGFTTRLAPGAGRGPDAARLLADGLGVRRLGRMQQVHGNHVAAIAAGVELPAESAHDGTIFFGDGDALATDRDDLALVVVTADCVPLLLADRNGRAVAAVHAGWRGVAAGIAPRAVELLGNRFGVAPSALDALLGPAAGGCCYEVGPEVVEGLRPTAGGSHDEWLRPGRAERPHVDLRALVRRQLVAAGLDSGAIRIHADCTICRGDRWPSWRREGSAAGRIWAGIAATRSGRPD